MMNNTESTAASPDVVLCCDAHGRLTPVDRAALRFSPAVYGILIENEQILLQSHPETGRWHPPGGLVSREQSPQQALRQHFRTATGLTPDVGSLVMVDERLHYDGEHGYRLSILYYALQRPIDSTARLVNFAESTKPEWYSAKLLDRVDMQFGYDAIQAALLRRSV